MAIRDYIVDPHHPMAPPQEVWDALTEEQRERVVASLPDAVPFGETAPPEGDWHREAKQDAIDALKGFFERAGRSVYISSELTVYYPGAERFAPDLLAVFDVPTHRRTKWVVAKEGKGLDFVLEVHYGGERKKDTEHNVARYARLGIPEYFIHDRLENSLFGYRLPMTGAKAYVPIIPQHGMYHSTVLGLDLTLERERLRFLYAGAAVPWSDELVARLNQAMQTQEDKLEREHQLRLAAEKLAAEEAAKRAEEAAKRAEAEVKRAEAEARLAELAAELERLRRQ